MPQSYCFSIKFHTDIQTYRATARGPIGPKNKSSRPSELHSPGLKLDCKLHSQKAKRE